jgi:hypothetical protein
VIVDTEPERLAAPRDADGPAAHLGACLFEIGATPE